MIRVARTKKLKKGATRPDVVDVLICYTDGATGFGTMNQEKIDLLLHLEDLINQKVLTEKQADELLKTIESYGTMKYSEGCDEANESDSWGYR